MINFIVCEDNLSTCDHIKDLLEIYIKKYNIDSKVFVISDDFTSIFRVPKEHTSTNVYLLDIKLTDTINGIDIATEIRKHDIDSYITFITDYPNYSLTILQKRIRAFDFIYKGDKEFKERLEENIIRINKEVKQSLEREDDRAIFLLTERVHQKFYLKDIIYFQIKTGTNKIVAKTVNARIEFYGSLKYVEEKIDNRFTRCHPSILINTQHIKNLCPNGDNPTVTMTNGDVCSVSKKYYKGINENVINK